MRIGTTNQETFECAGASEPRRIRHPLGAVGVIAASLVCLATVHVRASLAQRTPAAGVAWGLPGGAATATRQGDVHGRVVSAAGGAAVAGATVEVTAAADTTALARASSGADGAFRLDRLLPGRYRVRIRRLGFAPKVVSPVVVAAASASVDLGPVALTPVPVELQAVTSVAQKQVVDLAPDRNTYVVRDMPTTKGGSALDVLRTVPSVDVDMDNVVSLRGDAGVVVQINGRPSPMKPAQLGNFLAQLPAAMVEKVEVIPNPSAKDNPEGSSGIINIVLRKDAEPGANGGLTLAGSTTGRADVGGNGGYQQAKLTLFGSYGFSRDSRPRNETIFRQNLYADPLTYLEASGARTQIPLSHTVTGSAGYKFDTHDELGADLLFSTRHDATTNTISYRNLNRARQLTGLSDRASIGTNDEGSFESTVNYKHTFDTRAHTLTSELRVVRDHEGGPNAYTTQGRALDGAAAGAPARETVTVRERPAEYSFKVDYARPLGSHARLGAGYKGSLQQFHTTMDTDVLDATGGTFVVDPTRTNDFNYDQHVHAGYGMLSAQTGKVRLQAGLRLDRAGTRFHLNGPAGDIPSTYVNAYTSLFPSGLVAYDLGETRQVKLSYSTRIRRPDDTDVIDPTMHYQDPLNLSRGNPYLKPEYARALELGLQQDGERATLQVTPFYRHTLDAVRRIRTVDAAGVTTTTFANVATTDAYGTDATVALHEGRLTGFVGASAFRQVSNAANLAAGLSARAFGWTARTNTGYRLSKTFDLQAVVSYRAPMTVEQGRTLSQTRVSLAARRKLMADRVNVTLRVVDPFDTERERSITTDPRFYQTSDRRRQARGLLLNVAWNFGASVKTERDGIDQGSDVVP